MLPVSALSTAFAGPPPARMHATLPGVKDPSPYTIYSGYLDAGVPPSGRGKMSGPTPALAPTLALALALALALTNVPGGHRQAEGAGEEGGGPQQGGGAQGGSP